MLLHCRRLMSKLRTDSPSQIQDVVRRIAGAARQSLRGLALIGLIGAIGCATYIDKAREAKDYGEYEKAESLYLQSMEKDKDDLDRGLAREELVAMKVALAKSTAKSDPTKAEQLYLEALELDSSDEEAQDGLARVLASIGRVDEAIKILGGEAGYGKCDLCERYLAVLLKKRGQTREANKKFEAAHADYSRAFKLLADPSTAFAIARCLGELGRYSEAAKAIEDAVLTIRPEDRQAQSDFVRIRDIAVMRAIAEGDLELVDRYLAMFPPGSGGEPWYSLQLRVARKLWQRGKADVSIDRIEPLLGDKHRQSLPEPLRKEMVHFLEQLYTLRGVAFLRVGEIEEADKALARAGELAPDDEKIKLLRALAFAGRGDLSLAVRVVQAMSPKTRGYNEVSAIISSLQVYERLDVGDVEGAKAALAKAQKSSPDMPEVHVAAAAILAITPVEGLSRKDIKILRRSALANYTTGIFRYGEALSEIVWAREQSKSLGPTYLFRGPGSEQRMDTIERQIRELFPFGVSFNPEPTTLLSLRRRSGDVEVRIEGGGVEESVSVGSGKSPPIKLTEPGLVMLSYGRSKVAIVAESYTGIQIELP
ncbi:MAG TPA: tetratricopeptide repeat protein [Nannocystis exedens]|nr:tetratricopeptide repeat protein [Nannocystis exedens]